MTPAGYARHRGVSPQAVWRAIHAQRITTVVVNGKQLIDPEVADIQWQANTRPTHSALAAALPVCLPPASDPPRPPSSAEAQLYDIQAARAKREHHEANLADLRERKAAGALLERTRVEKAAAAVAAVVKGGLEQLPGKLAVPLAAETDVAQVRVLLNAAFAETLANMADALDRMTGVELPEEPAAP